MTEELRQNPARNSAAVGTGTNVYAIPPDQLENLDRALEKLLDQSKARCGLILDRTGMILAYAGDFHPVNPQVMGATAAGVIAALNSMVARAASPEINVRFYGSEVDRIHFLLLGDRLILCLLLGRTALGGNVRSAVKAFSSSVQPMLERFRPDARQAEDVLKSVQYIESKLDDMFKDYK